MYLLSIFLSLFSFCLSGLCGKQLGHTGSIRVSLFCILLSFLISVFMLFEVGFYKSPVYIELFYWFNSEVLNVKWSFLFDSLTIVMCLVVSFISFLVHLYSTEYMSNDPHLSRFMSYLSLFTFFMMILITSDNFLQLFVGWEGVGLCSYLLINFWFTRIQANKAAIKAMILNRIGDFSLIIGILLIFVNFKTVDFSTLSVLVTFFTSSTIFSYNLLNVIGFFLFVGAMGKSAQIGLHTWLPDAMEGPTPVSALIHAATMVTAGIFLIIRVSFLYEFNFKTLEMIIFIGVLTSFIASTTGLVQNDLKKVIAYSTCSQLGYMIFSCGLSNYSISLFHLLNHAFFKALLFLSAGSVIHSISDEQDMRKMGGLRYLLPFSYTMILIGSLALIGFPFLTGFYSKDLILEVAFSKYNNFGFFSYFFGTLGAFFSSFYSARLIFLTFLSKPNGFKKILCFSKDSGNTIKFVLGVLSIPSIFVGFYSKEFLVGVGSSFFFNSIYFHYANFVVFDAEFVITIFKLLPVLFSLFGFTVAFILYFFSSFLLYKVKSVGIGKILYNFLNRKWYFDKIYNDYIGQFFFKVGYSASYKFLDRGIFEIIGPTGISLVSLNISSKIHKFQTNELYHTLLSIIIGITLLFFFRFDLTNNECLNLLLLNIFIFIV